MLTEKKKTDKINSNNKLAYWRRLTLCSFNYNNKYVYEVLVNGKKLFIHSVYPYVTACISMRIFFLILSYLNNCAQGS